MGSLRGEINGWVCEKCGVVSYCVHVDDGVTPMFLLCQQKNGCGDGVGTSLMYPRPQPAPQRIIDEVEFEWFRPTPEEAREATLEMRKHILHGGLDLRELSDVGREVLGELPG